MKSCSTEPDVSNFKVELRKFSFTLDAIMLEKFEPDFGGGIVPLEGFHDEFFPFLR